MTFAAEWGRGWTLSARAPGWRAEPFDVRAPAPGAQPEDVSLVLRPIPQMTSQVLGPGERPQPSAQVTLYVRIGRAAGDDAGPREWNDVGLLVIPQSDGPTLMNLVRKARIDADGRFALDVDIGEHHALLVTSAPGLLTDVRRLRPDRDDLEAPIRLRAPSRPEDRVAITLGGQPLRVPRFEVIDVTDPQMHISYTLELADGTVVAESFIRDHEYIFGTGFGSVSRRLRWDGRATIALDELPVEPPARFQLQR